MANPDTSLLFGPYQAPRVKRGNRAYCLYRNSAVVISSWTDARISWPRCQVLGQQGGSGLLVDEELLWAIMSESVVAIKHWWGVGNKAIWNWRRAFGVTQWGTEGSRRLHQALGENGAAKLRGKKLPRALVRRRVKIRAERGTLRLPDRWGEKRWKRWELDLLGTAPDAELAARFGRTVNAVRVMRNRLRRRAPAVVSTPDYAR